MKHCVSVRGMQSSSLSWQGAHVHAEARLVDHRQLMQWTWNYFTDELSTGATPPGEAHDHAWREHIEDDPVILSGARCQCPSSVWCDLVQVFGSKLWVTRMWPKLLGDIEVSRSFEHVLLPCSPLIMPALLEMTSLYSFLTYRRIGCKR